MTCPTCLQKMHSVQYRLTPCDFDGISEFACDQCALRIGRWSGLTLEEGELEARWGVDSPYKMGLDVAPRIDVRSDQALRGEIPKGVPQARPIELGEDDGA